MLQSKTNGPLKIYLDQNKWIELSRCYYGRGNSDLAVLLRTALLAVEQEVAVFPFSHVHVMEAQHRKDKSSATRLMNFIWMLSKGIAVTYVTRIMPIEMENAVIRYLGKSELCKPVPVLGYGIEFLFGKDASFLADILEISESRAALIFSIMDRPGTLKKILLDAVVRPTPYLLKERGRKLARLIEDRRALWSQYDQKIRKRARFALEVAAIAQNHGIPAFYMDESIDLNTRMLVLESIPPLNVIVTLGSERDESLSRRPQPNDLGDIDAMSVAIPYCDIVVTEKHWAHVALREGLDKEYETHVLTNIKALEPILTQALVFKIEHETN